MVLAAVGKNGTGKDFFLEYVAKTYDFPMISIGDVVRELAAQDGLELTRDNLHATSKKYMTANGQTFFPEMIVKKIKESDSPNFLVSGIRPPSDIEDNIPERSLICTSAGFLITASTGEGDDKAEILFIASSPISSFLYICST